MSKTACGKQDGVLCTRRYVVYKTVCGVHDGVWCTRRCVVYKTAWSTYAYHVNGYTQYNWYRYAMFSGSHISAFVTCNDCR